MAGRRAGAQAHDHAAFHKRGRRFAGGPLLRVGVAPFLARLAIFISRKRLAHPGFSTWAARDSPRPSAPTSLVITDPDPV